MKTNKAPGHQASTGHREQQPTGGIGLACGSDHLKANNSFNGLNLTHLAGPLRTLHLRQTGSTSVGFE